MTRKKQIANEIVCIFKKIKISMFIGIICFTGFSVYNKLFQYSLFDYDFGWTEVEEVLGYVPSQYTFVADKIVIEQEINVENEVNRNTSIEKELEKIDSYFANLKKSEQISIDAFNNDTYTGSMKISDDGKLEVKKEIISQLLKNSLVFTLIMILATFVMLISVYYINRGINWTKRYVD